MRRKALQPFTFSDGVHVRAGEWVCVPHRAMMRDPRRFPDAAHFDAFRFYKLRGPDESRSQECLTDASEKWLAWGLGRIVWYVTFPYLGCV